MGIPPRFVDVIGAVDLFEVPLEHLLDEATARSTAGMLENLHFILMAKETAAA